MHTIKQSAITLSREGYSVIPVNSDKRPLIKWKNEQGEGSRSTPEQVENLFSTHPLAQVAIITGWNKLGILDLDVKVKDPDGDWVVDPDKRALAEKIVDSVKDSTLVAETPSGGFHIYFHFDGDIPYQSFSMGEVRTDKKHYTLVPPSNGYKYLNMKKIAEGWNIDVVRGLLKTHGITLEEKVAGEAVWKQFKDTEVVPEGQRHDWLVSRGGSYRRQGDDVETIYQKLKVDAENRTQGDVPEEELRTIAESMEQYPQGVTPAPQVQRPMSSAPTPVPEPTELVPFTSTRPAPFPLDALPDKLAAWSQAVAEETQVPVDMPAMCAIGVIATAVQRKINIQASEGHTEALCAWTIAVMESGNRKSPVFRRALNPLVIYEQKTTLEMQDEVAKSQATYEALKQEMENIKRDKKMDIELRTEKMTEIKVELAKHKLIRAPRHLTDDCTPEKLAQLLSWHAESLAIASSESDVFQIILGRYSKGMNVELYLKAYSGDRHSVDRKSAKSIDLHAPALSMVLTAQPSVIVDLKKIPQIEDRGLLARFWYTIPASFVGRRQINTAVVPSSLEADYNDSITHLLSIKQQVDDYDNINPYTIRLSSKAKDVYLEYAEKIEPQLASGSGELSELQAWGNKLVGSMVRLMGIIHLYENATVPQPWAEEVSEETAHKAAKLADYLKSHAIRAYDVMRTDSVVNDAQYVWRRILNIGDTFTQREVNQAVKKRIQTVGELEPTLTLLTDLGYIVELPHEPKNGRPSRVFRVNVEAKKQEIKELDSYPQYPQNLTLEHAKQQDVNSNEAYEAGNQGSGSEEELSDEDLNPLNNL